MIIDQLENIRKRHGQRYGSPVARIGTDADISWLIAEVDRLRDTSGVPYPPPDRTLEGESNAVRQ